MYPQNLSFVNCAKGPSQGGLPVAELKELAKKMGIDPKLTKAEICNEMAKVFNKHPSEPIMGTTGTTGTRAPATSTSSTASTTPPKLPAPKAYEPEPIPIQSSSKKILTPPKVVIRKVVTIPTSTQTSVIPVIPVRSEEAQHLDTELQGKGKVKALKSTTSQGLVSAVSYHINTYNEMPPYFKDVMGMIGGSNGEIIMNPYYSNINPLLVKLGLLDFIVKSGNANKNPKNTQYTYLKIFTILNGIDRPWELPMKDYMQYYTVTNDLIKWAHANDPQLAIVLEDQIKVSHIFINAVNNGNVSTIKEVMKAYPPSGEE
ncbi:MAG: hypothetical protein WD512_11810, partial [Candidatus Paceibacterota bacterium]